MRSLVLLGPLAVLTACGATPEPSPTAADCGTYVVKINDDFPAGAARCFVEALEAGRPATLKVTRPSDEGDPIPVIWTVRADGSAEVITDMRQDNFGPKVIYREVCREPDLSRGGLMFTTCTEATPVPAPR